MSAAHDVARQHMLEGIGRLGAAKGMVDVCAKLLESIDADALTLEQEEFFNRLIKHILRFGVEERNAAVAILGEQGIDAKGLLTAVEEAIGEAPDADPR